MGLPEIAGCIVSSLAELGSVSSGVAVTAGGKPQFSGSDGCMAWSPFPDMKVGLEVWRVTEVVLRAIAGRAGRAHSAGCCACGRKVDLA